MAQAELAAIIRAKNEAKAELDDFRNGLSGTEQGFLRIPPAAALATAGIALAVTAAVAATKAAFELGESFDSAFDTIQTKSGATGQALEQLKDDFRAVVGSIPTDFKAAGDAIGALAARTGQSGESLQQLSIQMLELSRITNTDINENVRSVTRLFGDWSVATAQQAETLDKLFRAAQISGSSVSELSQRVVQFGAPMRQLGIDLDDAIALFTRWEREGVNVETVAGTMRIALAKLAEAGVDPTVAFRGLVRAIEEMEDPLQATQIAMEVFGKRGGADMAAAIREGRFAIDEMKEAINGAGDGILETASKTNDAKEQMQVALNNIALAFEPVGTAVFQLAADVVTKFAEIVSTVKQALADLRGEAERTVIAPTVDPEKLFIPAGAAAATARSGPGTAAPDPAAAAAAKRAAEDAAAAAFLAMDANSEAAKDAAKEAKEKARKDAQAQRDWEREVERIVRAGARDLAAAQREAEQEAKRAAAEAKRQAEQEERRIEQLRELGQRRTNAIIEATTAAQEAIEEAQRRGEENRAKAEADFIRDRDLAAQREQLQKNITDGIEAARARQTAAQRDLQRSRDTEDIGIRRARENEDLRTRRAGAAGSSAQQAARDQEALDAIRFKGNSLEILAALKAAQTRKEGVQDQLAEEDRALALRRSREDEDHQRRLARQEEDLARARRDIDEITALRAQLAQPLEDLNRRILEDTLAEKITAYYTAEAAAVAAAQARFARAEETADFNFNEGARRLGGDLIQNITVNNYGALGDDAIRQLTEQTFDEAEMMMNQTG